MWKYTPIIPANRRQKLRITVWDQPRQQLVKPYLKKQAIVGDSKLESFPHVSMNLKSNLWYVATRRGGQVSKLKNRVSEYRTGSSEWYQPLTIPVKVQIRCRWEGTDLDLIYPVPLPVWVFLVHFFFCLDLNCLSYKPLVGAILWKNEIHRSIEG
jgi:hypothetical protein